MKSKLYIMEKVREKSSFIGTIIIIVAIITITVSVISYSYFTRARYVVISNSTEANRNMLNQINVSVNLLVDSIIDVSKQSYNDTILNELLKQDNLNDYSDIRILASKLDGIKNANRYIHSVLLYMENSNKVVSSEHGIIDADSITDNTFADWYQNSPNNLYLADTHPIFMNESARNQENVFSVYARLPMNRTHSFYGALVININQSMISELVVENLDNQGDTYFYITDNTGNIIFSKDEQDLYSNIYSKEFLELGELTEDESSYKTVHIDGKPHLIVYEHLEKRDWNYIVVYPYTETYKTIQGMRSMVFAISFLVVVISSILSLIVISRAFKPLNEITKFIQSKVNHLKKDKSNGLKEAIYDIYSSNEKMKEKLNIAMPFFREKFILNLVTKKNINKENILEQLTRFSIELPIDNLILTIFDIDNYDSPSQREIYDEYISKLTITEITEEYFKMKGMKLTSVETESGKVVIIFQLKLLGIPELIEDLKKVKDILYEKLNVSVTISVCDSITDIYGLYECYTCANAAAKHKILYGSNDIILCSDIQKDNINRYQYPYDKEDYLINHIKVLDKDSALSTLHEIIMDIGNSKSYFVTQLSIYHLNASIMRLIDEISLPVEEIYAQTNLEEISLRFGSLKDVEDYFYSIIVKIIRFIEKSRSNKTDEYFERVVSFIHNNYMNEITVSQICEYCNLSSTYVHQILKNYTGKTVVQYINEYRVEKATELLANTDKKIMDIAKEVGFSSAKYFIRIFKSIKGITPGEARKA